MSRFVGVVCGLSYEWTEIAAGFSEIDQAIGLQEAKMAALLLLEMEERLVQTFPQTPEEFLIKLVSSYEALYYLRKKLSAQLSAPRLLCRLHVAPS